MTSNKEIISASKFLSLVLRHQPESIGIELDASGWTPVEVLISKAASAGRLLTRSLLEEVVRTSDKKRFALSEDGLCIRANQGHSIEIDLGLAPVTPPDTLFHGTATRFLESILAHGLDKRKRHHVHLTEDLAIARAVGQRYGQLALLQVDAKSMTAKGHRFYRSENNVWLTDRVPPEFLSVQENAQ